MRPILLRTTALALALAVAPTLGGSALAQSPDKKPGLADPLEQAPDAAAGVNPAEPPPGAPDAAPPAPPAPDRAAETPPAPPIPPSAAEDDPGAKAIREALVPYVTQLPFERRVLVVAKEGQGFRIGFDLRPLMGEIDPTVGRFEMAPYSVLVSERSDGDWDVTANDPIRFSADFKDQVRPVTLAYDIPDSTFTGVWSPSLGTFTSGHGRAGPSTVRQFDSQAASDATMGALDYTIEARPTGVGEADVSMEQRLDGMTQRIESKGDPATGTPAMTVDMDLGRIDIDSKGTALRTRPILDLWAFLVPRIDETGAKIKADQDEFRAKLKALLPLWRTLSGSYEVHDLKVTSPFGGGSAATAGQFMSFDGISGGGSYTWRLDMEGLSVRSPFLPEWVPGLLPEDIRISVSARNVDLKTPADIFLREFDLNNPDILPPAAGEAIARSFAERPPSVVIDPGYVRGKDYEVTYESTITFSGPDKADTRSLVTAKGLDAIVASLQKIGTPEANSAIGGINFAKGFGTALPDGRTRWEVETKADGAVLVNGFQLVAPTAETLAPGEDAPAPDAPPAPEAVPAPEPQPSQP